MIIYYRCTFRAEVHRFVSVADRAHVVEKNYQSAVHERLIVKIHRIDVHTTKTTNKRDFIDCIVAKNSIFVSFIGFCVETYIIFIQYTHVKLPSPVIGDPSMIPFNVYAAVISTIGKLNSTSDIIAHKSNSNFVIVTLSKPFIRMSFNLNSEILWQIRTQEHYSNAGYLLSN